MPEEYDEVLAANAAYVARDEHPVLDIRPVRRLAIVTCMDARIAAFPVLGLQLGDAHVIRNAGARVTDDVLRSLALSTHVLGVRKVLVVGHTRCGLFDPQGTIDRTLTELMGRPPFTQTWGTFTDPKEAISRDCQRLLDWPDRPEGLLVAGYLLDVNDGRLTAVVSPTAARSVDPDR